MNLRKRIRNLMCPHCDEDRKQRVLNSFDSMMDKIQKISIRTTKENDDPTKNYMSIPNNAYVEFGDHVYLRRITDPSDIKYEWEKGLDDFIQTLDFDSYHVMHKIILPDGRTPAHCHFSDETLYCVEGEIKDLTSDKLCLEGEKMIIPSYTVHKITSKKFTNVIVTLGKVQKQSEYLLIDDCNDRDLTIVEDTKLHDIIKKSKSMSVSQVEDQITH